MTTTALIVSNTVLWVLVVALSLIVLALARQIGVLHERIAPAGALMLRQGLQVGKPVPAFELDDIRGNRITIGAKHPGDRSTLLFFVSPTCPICKALLPVLKSSRLSERKWLDIVLASDGNVEEQRKFVASHGLDMLPYVVSLQLGMAFEVNRLPYAAVIDEHGVLRARGIVNSREHLESLFEAKDRGVASLQEYFSAHAKTDAA